MARKPPISGVRTYRWKGKSYTVPRRDTQQTKVYDAERAAFGDEGGPWGISIGDGELEAATAFIRKVEASQTWQKLNDEHYTNPLWGGLEVRDGRGCSAARGCRTYLILPRWARVVPVVLHEMSHSVATTAQHHWPFTNVYLSLVARFMSGRDRDALKAEFKNRRVRFAPPRQFSKEHMAKLRAQGHRLAAAARVKREKQ